ncbi:hypothetical protein FE257_008481 [Aspergillus nanangensis]|uniref:Zn(2)-C6 fungal-type domain-containing protein n=1 Tax=Aspergillus nanangensis TaxID=2582783 RepID=A0AAD4GTE4_ASPNN|nr:hypothetical protein FE257_008481 [Aspergillus nanangensis]
MSPRTRGQRPESRQPPSLSRRRGRESHRSRKGCPECRKRKIKCDEQKPECGQCLRGGRSCHIIDTLFRPHTYTFLTPSTPRTAGQFPPPTTRSPTQGPVSPTAHNRDVDWDERQQDFSFVSDTSPAFYAAPGCEDSPLPPNNHQPFLYIIDPDQSPILPLSSPLHTLQPRSEITPQVGPQSLPQDQDRRQTHTSSGASQFGPAGTDYQDWCEIACFLRCFSEGPGQWMDIHSPQQSYFSQHIIALSHHSPLVRYAACSLAAKQLGQMQDLESTIKQPPNQQRMLKKFSDSKLDFLWYGAKYYEKAIQMLARQISHEDISVFPEGLSPNGIYHSGLTPQSADYSVVSDHDAPATIFQILAACILCEYEDLSATMRAWSGHLDVVTQRQTRLICDNPRIWRNMGLPIGNEGQLDHEYMSEVNADHIIFKALIYLMCRLICSSLTNVTEWTNLNEIFDQWHSTLPPSFGVPITWQPQSRESNSLPASQPDQRFSCETWFASDICAISMALYHMARMLLLIHRPVELIHQASSGQTDLLTAYNTLQQRLREHAMEIIPIARGMPSPTVWRYILQPLYVAGRCLVDPNDRQELLDLLKQVHNDLGIFTRYRQKDLSVEWGIPYEEEPKEPMRVE